MSNRPHLWEVVKESAGDEALLRAAVALLNREQLIYLYRQMGIAAGQLHAAGPDWKVAAWTVSRGRKAWLEAMENPASLAASAPADAPDFLGTIKAIFHQRFGDEIPDQEPDPSLEPGLRYDPSWDQKLWDLIDAVNVGVPLDDALSGYTRSDLIRLDLARRVISAGLVDRFTDLLGEDPNGSGWGEWTDWMIGQGKDRIDEVLSDPSSAQREVPADAPLFVDDLDQAYQRRYGTRLPTPKS